MTNVINMTRFELSLAGRL